MYKLKDRTVRRGDPTHFVYLSNQILDESHSHWQDDTKLAEKKRASLA